MVSPSEGNEVRRDGRQGAGAFHSNVEAGELDRRTPRSEGDAVSTDRWREHGGCIGTRGRVHETTTDSGSRRLKRGAVCVNCASTDWTKRLRRGMGGAGWVVAQDGRDLTVERVGCDTLGFPA